MSAEHRKENEQLNPMGQVWPWPRTDIITAVPQAYMRAINGLTPEVLKSLNYDYLQSGDLSLLDSVCDPLHNLVRAQHAYIQAFYMPPSIHRLLTSQKDYQSPVPQSPVSEEERMYSIFEEFDPGELSKRLQSVYRERSSNPEWVRQDVNYNILLLSENIQKYLKRTASIVSPELPKRKLGKKLDFLNYVPFYAEFLRSELPEFRINRQVDLTFYEKSDNRVVHVFDHDLERQYMLASTGGLAELYDGLKTFGINLQIMSVNQSKQTPTTPQSVVFDVDGVLRDRYANTHHTRAQLFQRLNSKGIPYGIWTRNGGKRGDRIQVTHGELQTSSQDYRPSFGVNFDNWPYQKGDDLEFTTLPEHLNAAEEDFAYYLQQLQADGEKYYRTESFLECKSSRLLATLPEHEGIASQLEQGVLIDDRKAGIVGAVLFGHSFVHLHDINKLQDVAHMIGV